jgi:phosphoribosyl-ATP pyrophosphohydrolase/phosphoribosyl-AMP cyclohydrolase
MLAYMNEAALARTLESGKATFFSRSRGQLWTKGETSGHFLLVRSVVADCDADTLLLLVEPVGPSCHTGRPACFFRRVDAGGALTDLPCEATPFLSELGEVLYGRKQSTSEKSYTKSLLEAGPDKIGAKIREEAGELAEALKNETDERVLSEAADVIYHVMVGLTQRGLDWREVIEVLAKRTHRSGHAEKASR